jgi:hypothetical protein
MAFFARPNLDDLQFKQLTGSTLTLSGQTRIENPVGFELTDGTGGYRPIVATGGTQFDVLTLVGSKIILHASTSSGSTGVYTCASPTTCTVGGLPAGTSISGCTLSYILQKILVPSLPPIITPPSHSAFIVTPSTNLYEVGTSISICVTSCFDRGCVNPQYCGADPKRSGLPTCYNYTDFGVPQAPVVSAACCNCHALSAHVITNGNNIVSGTVNYAAEVTPAYDSTGGTSFIAPNPLPAGVTTPARSCTICGLYPYFYGKVASGGAPAGSNRPTPTCALVIAGTKVVADSISPISITFNSTSDDYIWFATPNASPTKVCWYVSALNNGAIGGAVSAGGNLFPSPASVNPVTTVCWAGQTYKVYISNYQTASNTLMTLS